MEETEIKRESKKGHGNGKQGFKKKGSGKIYNKKQSSMPMIF